MHTFDHAHWVVNNVSALSAGYLQHLFLPIFLSVIYDMICPAVLLHYVEFFVRTRSSDDFPAESYVYRSVSGGRTHRNSVYLSQAERPLYQLRLQQRSPEPIPLRFCLEVVYGR